MESKIMESAEKASEQELRFQRQDRNVIFVGDVLSGEGFHGKKSFRRSSGRQTF